MRYQILRPVNCYAVVFWIMTPCSTVDSYIHFGETFCLRPNRNTASFCPPNCRCYSPVDMYWSLFVTLFFIVQSSLWLSEKFSTEVSAFSFALDISGDNEEGEIIMWPEHGGDNRSGTSTTIRRSGADWASCWMWSKAQCIVLHLSLLSVIKVRKTRSSGACPCQNDSLEQLKPWEIPLIKKYPFNFNVYFVTCHYLILGTLI
jgi:hypothetical protein